MPPSDDPAQMLALAQDYAKDLRFSEALERYRGYLCRCPQDEQARQAMHDLENRRADYLRLREVYELADKCSFRLKLQDAMLSEHLTGLHRALHHGPGLEAEELAGLVLQQLEDLMRREWGLTVQDDLWWEAVQRASERDFYDLAVELLARSPRHLEQSELFEAIAGAGDLLEFFEVYGSTQSLAVRLAAQKLREAIQQRDLQNIESCCSELTEFLTPDAQDPEDDSPGLGVPIRPCPPRPSDAARHWN